MGSPLRDLSEAVDRMAHVRPDGIAARKDAARKVTGEVEKDRRAREVNIDGGTTGEQRTSG